MDFACEKENGDRWDFTRSSDRDEAMAVLEKDDPDWVIGSPPCTAFSLLNVGLNYLKMSKPEVKRRIMLGTYALSAGYYDAYYLKAQKVRTHW